MNGHLARLAARAIRPTSDGLRPRVPALFEQPAGLPADPAIALPLSAVHGGDPLRDLSRARGRAAAGPAPVPPSRSSDGRGVRDGAVPGAGQGGSHDEDPRDTQRSPDRGASISGRIRPPDAVPPASAPSPEEPPPGSPAPRSPSARSTVPEPVVASLVATAVSAGLRPLAGDRVRHGSREDEQGTPPAGAPTGPPVPAALLTAPLPRLQPELTRTARSDLTPAAPAVTVNIGRIEVVPPPPAPPQPPAQPRRPRSRASGAPPLAEFLRDRSRR